MVICRVEYSSWKSMILTPRLFYIHPCLSASLMVMCRVQYNFSKVAILTLFHSHPCLVARLVVIF